MITQNQIRENLRNIRYYYTKKEFFDKGTQEIGASGIVETARLYGEIVKTAPPQIFELYVAVYVKGITHEAFSADMGFSVEYSQKLNRKLLTFLAQNLQKQEI